MISFLRILALVSVAYGTKLQDDFNCTIGGKWAPNAVACEDTISICATIATPAPAIKVGTDEDDRATGCKSSEEQKQAMIKMCPKTCGYCCLTPAYTCKNKEFPGVKCETITQAQCKDPKWREIIASECPNVCGFCNEGGCVDAVIECENDKSICRNIDMQPFVRVSCKKTCGFCDNNGSFTTPGYGSGIITSTGSSATCFDRDVNCIYWARHGYCSNPFYSTKKYQLCRRTCGLCY